MLARIMIVSPAAVAVDPEPDAAADIRPGLSALVAFAAGFGLFVVVVLLARRRPKQAGGS
ncbi:MAG: hypothetical protein H0U52_04470 [Chloroflexi bacterium]|nr:hypothetical protein [Chloroflexota bacterium]